MFFSRSYTSFGKFLQNRFYLRRRPKTELIGTKKPFYLSKFRKIERRYRMTFYDYACCLYSSQASA